jgi:hypothetical protein
MSSRLQKGIQALMGTSSNVCIGNMNVVWLLSVVKLVKGEVASEFVKSPRDGKKLFSAQRVQTSLTSI